MKVSVLIPVYQEISHIESVYNFVTKSDPLQKEIFFIDGGSSDGTFEFLDMRARAGSDIFVLSNPHRTVPFALNMAIPMCTGDIIVRLDAHTEYSIDYFEKIIETFGFSRAEIVGGPMRIAKGTALQNAVGLATTSPFGIGNSSFHFERFEGYTDSVYLGAWRRDIFDKVGLFDVSFTRNQDDEFHYRSIKFGLKIYQNPEIELYYHPRNSYSKLFSQYFQYGLYKPMVLLKNKNGLRLRHLIPAFFVLYIAFHLLLFFDKNFSSFPLMLYSIFLLYFSWNNKANLLEKILTIFTFPVIHIGYGLGFLIGILKLSQYKLK